MRPRVPSIAIFLAMAIIQSSLGELVSVHGVRPSLILVAVYALSVSGGEWRGLAYGSLGGLIEDCLSGGYMGLSMSGYAIVGYLVGRAGRKVINIGESANLAGIFAASLANGIYVSVVLETFRGGPSILGSIFGAALPQALYNALAGVLVLRLFKGPLERRAPWLRVIRQLEVRL